MPKRRTLDPSNLPPMPNPTADPAREAELLSELRARFGYVVNSYRLARDLEARFPSINDSIDELARATVRRNRSSRPKKRLNPMVEIVVTYHARELAKERSGEVEQRDFERAVRKTVQLLKKSRGRPADGVLHLHLSGIIALVQQFTGQPVLAHRDRNSVYEPHFADGVSQLVPMVFAQTDPAVTLTQLVDEGLKIRKEYAGKPLRFEDLFPMYRATVDGDGEFNLMPGFKMERYEQNIPIYYR